MEAKTSNNQTTPSSQLNQMIAEGKRKEESGRPALSLQDVFSDSANLEGMQQKTSSQFDTEQEKEAQLEKRKKQKRGGRKKMDPSQKRSVKLQLHVTEQEYSKLQTQMNAVGTRFLSDYLRALILNEKNLKLVIDRVALIKQLDGIGGSINKIGTNINQLTKYANIQLKTGKMDQTTISRFNHQIEKYLEKKGKLIKAYRALARNED